MGIDMLYDSSRTASPQRQISAREYLSTIGEREEVISQWGAPSGSRLPWYGVGDRPEEFTKLPFGLQKIAYAEERGRYSQEDKEQKGLRKSIPWLAVAPFSLGIANFGAPPFFDGFESTALAITEGALLLGLGYQVLRFTRAGRESERSRYRLENMDVETEGILKMGGIRGNLERRVEIEQLSLF